MHGRATYTTDEIKVMNEAWAKIGAEIIMKKIEDIEHVFYARGRETFKTAIFELIVGTAIVKRCTILN